MSPTTQTSKEESLFEWFTSEKEPKKVLGEILQTPETLEKLRLKALSYLRRPQLAVSAGIRAGIERQPVLPHIIGGLKGEEETQGRDILQAIGAPLDNPDWILNHPVQHFLVEFGGAGIEFVTDPLVWIFWFAPAIKGLKPVQKFIAKRQVTSMANQLRADLSVKGISTIERTPKQTFGLFKDTLSGSKYTKYTKMPWYKSFVASMGNAEKIAKAKTPLKLSYVFSAGLPKEMITKEGIKVASKFAPLITRAGGIIPKLGTGKYMEYWKSLTPEEQKLETERRKPKETLFAPEEIAPTKQMDMYKVELDKMKRAGMNTTDTKIKAEAMRIAGEKYTKETGKPAGVQTEWQLGGPVLKGQKEFKLPEGKTVDEITLSDTVWEFAHPDAKKYRYKKLSELTQTETKDLLAHAESWELSSSRGISAAGRRLDVALAGLKKEFIPKAKIVPTEAKVFSEFNWTETPPPFVGVERIPGHFWTTFRGWAIEDNQMLKGTQVRYHIHAPRGGVIATAATPEEAMLNISNKTGGLTPEEFNYLYKRAYPELAMKEGFFAPEEPKIEVSPVDKLKIGQNKAIEEDILNTGSYPNEIKQSVYIHNLAKEHYASLEEQERVFEDLLKKNNPKAYECLTTGIPDLSLEEMQAKITSLDKEISKIKKGADAEIKGMIEWLYSQATTEKQESLLVKVKKQGGIKHTSAIDEYGTKKDEGWNALPLSVRNNKTGLSFDILAEVVLHMEKDELYDKLVEYQGMPKKWELEDETYGFMETHLEEFPNYAKKTELEEQKEQLQNALNRVEAKDKPFDWEEDATEQVGKEVKIEPESEEEVPFEKEILPEEEKIIEEEKPFIDINNIKEAEDMPLYWKDILAREKVKPPIDLDSPTGGEQLTFSNILPPEDGAWDKVDKVEPWPETNVDVGALGWFRRSDFLFSDYERASGIPIASEGAYPIADASKLMRREEMVYSATVGQVLKQFSKERRIAIGKAMEGKKVKLNEDEKQAVENMRDFYKFLGKEFNIPEKQMLEDYLPRIMKFAFSGDPTVLPKNMQAWFKKHRIGKLRYKLKDPLEITRIYIHSGLRDKYLYESGLIPKFLTHIKNLPYGIKKKIEYWLTHRILRHPTPVDANVDTSIKNLMNHFPEANKLFDKWGTTPEKATRNVTTAVTQLIYCGGIGFRVVSAGKNLTQAIHNLAIWGPYTIKGLMDCSKPEEKKVIESLNILRRYGAELERRGIENPASIPQKIVDAGNFLFRLADSLHRRVSMAAARDLVRDMDILFKKGKINQAEFLNRTKFSVIPYGRQKEALELINKGDMEGYANLLGKEGTLLGQYTYESEDMPLAFAGNAGRLASVFMSWPIEFAEMNYHFYKTGNWKAFIYYYLAAVAVQNGLRQAGIETNPYGYGDIKVGNTRISLIPGGWFLTGSFPTGPAPAVQILISGEKLAALYLKGTSKYNLAIAKRDFFRSLNIIKPAGLALQDAKAAWKDIELGIKTGKYGKRDKNGKLIYISNLPEVILRGLGFTTPTEAEKTGKYSKPILEIKGLPKTGGLTEEEIRRRWEEAGTQD